MAASGMDVNRGNSDQVPLSDKGRDEIQDTAAKLAARGGIDKAIVSTSVRGQQTADAIQAAHPPMQRMNDPNVESWPQGNLEGKPAKLVKDQIRELVRDTPTVAPDGQGSASSRPGQSFTDWSRGYLSSIRGNAMQELARDPSKKIGVITHSMGSKLVKGWLAAGHPDDFSIKPDAMEEAAEPPGGVERLYPNEDGEWEMNPVDMDSEEPLDPGIYMIRHGMTPWNKETWDKAQNGQQALIEIAKHTRSLNLNQLNAAARRARAQGALSDDEISGAIDQSLPDAKEAADLPPHHLMTIVTLASPQKRGGYMPVAQFVLGKGVHQLPDPHRGSILQHLQRIGVNSDQS